MGFPHPPPSPAEREGGRPTRGRLLGFLNGPAGPLAVPSLSARERVRARVASPPASRAIHTRVAFERITPATPIDRMAPVGFTGTAAGGYTGRYFNAEK